MQVHTSIEMFLWFLLHQSQNKYSNSRYLKCLPFWVMLIWYLKQSTVLSNWITYVYIIPFFIYVYLTTISSCRLNIPKSKIIQNRDICLYSNLDEHADQTVKYICIHIVTPQWLLLFASWAESSTERPKCRTLWNYWFCGILLWVWERFVPCKHASGWLCISSGILVQKYINLGN